MTQQDKELLLKDLCARLPYGMKVETPYNKCYYNSVNVIGVTKRHSGTKGIVYIDIITDKATYPIQYIKPYLRPMSSMTEEEAQEFHDLGGIVIYNADMKAWEASAIFPTIHVFDWLNVHHFDYRGLIDKGLAIAVTEENNSYE